MKCKMTFLKMYSFRCNYALRAFLLFPVLRLKKEMEKQKLFVQDKIKAIHKRKTTASIIKHSIIHINVYLEKGMNVVFHHHPNFFSYFFQFLCIPFVYCLYFFFVIHRVAKY